MLTVIYSWSQVTELKPDLPRRKIFAENVNYIVRHIVSGHVWHLLRRPRYTFSNHLLVFLNTRQMTYSKSRRLLFHQSNYPLIPVRVLRDSCLFTVQHLIKRQTCCFIFHRSKGPHQIWKS